MRPRFWVLRQSKSRPVKYAPGEVKFRHITCPANRDHNGTGRRSTPLSVILNKSVGDFLWTWGSELVIVPRVRSFMEEHRFTGYELKDVHARFRKPSYGVPPPLWEIKVLGWGGMASPASGLALTDSCTSCGLLEYRVDDSSRLIDPDRWDGSDLFMVWPLPLFIFLSDRGARLLRQARFTGIRIEPAEELDLSDGPTFTPGRLSDHMPAARARELGANLGIE